MSLTILYRGPLSSCNYGCGYCPFAKRHEDDAAHAHDAACLERFVSFCEAGVPSRLLSVFFTPWGEALTQPRYQEAMVRLSWMPHVRRVAVQTNLSARLTWVARARADRLGIWATYHPEWTTLTRFLDRCAVLLEHRVSFSVGVVGLPRARPALEALRRALPTSVYVWVNAVKAHPYSAEERAAFTAVDPLFPINLEAHESLGHLCAGGHTVLSVDGDGVARSCHFVREPLGNLYRPGFLDSLVPRTCPQERCGCHIGYVHLERLGLQQVFGDGILERVPAGPLHRPAVDGPSTAGSGNG